MRISYKQIFGLYVHLLDMRYGIEKFLDTEDRRLNKLKKKSINIAKYASVYSVQNIRKIFYKNFFL